MRKIILTGGGTAGHVWPIITLAQAMKKNSRLTIKYVGSFGLEKQLAQKYNIPFTGILVGKWRAYFSWQNLIDPFKTIIGIIQSFFIFLSFRPDIVFAKGGYVTVPVTFWAKIFGVPLVTHESDVILGKANRWAAKFAKKICLGFPVRFYRNLPMEKLVYTGIPIRPEFFQEHEIKNEKPTILITGGSQGSHRINELILDIADELLEKYEIYHICGKNDFSELAKSDYAKNSNYHLIDFSDKMPELMHRADLIISRAGADTLAQISAVGKPSILIPLPSASLDHQTANAKVYESSSAAVVVSEKKLNGDILLSLVDSLMEDNNLRQMIAHHAQEFSHKEAAQEIIDQLFEVAK